MDQGGTKHLLVIKLLAVAFVLDQAGGRAEVFGAEGAGSIQTEQVVPIVVGQLLKRLAPLQRRDDGFETRPQPCRINRIDHGSQLSIASDLADTVNPLKIGGISAAAFVESQ